MYRHRLTHEDIGASAVEYGLVVFAVAAVVALVVYSLGGVAAAMFSESCQVIDSQITQTAQCD